MQEESKNANFFDSGYLIMFLYRWWKPILIIEILAALSSFIFSEPFFITPKYKSSVILFPTSSNSISKALISNTSGPTQDILEFGEEEQVEQLIQILNSDEIRDKIVKKYDLMNHYNIDANAEFKNTALQLEFTNNISFSRTEFMSAEISVLDKSPTIAADIANDIASLVDTVKNRMQKERAIQGLKIVKEAYFGLVKEIRLLEDSLKILRKLGVFDYESQSEVMNDAYAQAVASGNSSAMKMLEDKLKILADYGGAYVSIRDHLEHEKKQLSEIKEKYLEAKIDAEQKISYKFIVSKAYPAEKKTYPVRWLIMVISLLSAFLLAMVVIMMIENISKLNFSKLRNKETE
jgi:uncharacterized protein involved in exopolysaccharide biosynthesis